MKYFTPDLMGLLNSPDQAVADAADTEWDRRLQQYEDELQRLEPELPEHVREFNSLLLHDARVLSIARQGDQLLFVMRKDIPPRDLVTLTYFLTEEPFIDRAALPHSERSPVMDYLYNEFDLVRDGEAKGYTEAILFSNGWEVRLCFRDVRVTLADPLYLLPGAALSSTSPALSPSA